MLRRLTLVLAFSVSVLFACSPAPTAPATPTRIPLLPTPVSTAGPTHPPVSTQPAPTELPPAAKPSATLEPTASASPNGLVDNFSDPTSGWDVRKTENGASGYRDGQYFIRVDAPKFQLWSSPGQPFQGDVIVEASASPVRGPEKNEMGVFCRYRDRQNFIYGSVSADGYYAIVEIKNNEETILTGNGKFQLSDAIPRGSATYVIRLACEGDRYTLFVNGQQIDSASSSAFSGGEVGLLGGTFDQGGVEILFDDFKVSRP